MKRIYTIALAFLLVLNIAAFAVEKTEKGNDKKKKEQTQQQPVQQPSAQRADSGKKQQPAAQQKPRTQSAKRYDNFVDKNNNGIDDRKENQKPKENPPQVPKTPK